MKREILKKFNNSKLCLVCGMENELGLKARFYAMDHDEILAVCIRAIRGGCTGVFRRLFWMKRWGGPSA